MAPIAITFASAPVNTFPGFMPHGSRVHPFGDFRASYRDVRNGAFSRANGDLYNLRSTTKIWIRNYVSKGAQLLKRRPTEFNHVWVRGDMIKCGL